MSMSYIIEQNQEMLFSFTEMYENVGELKEIKEYNFAKNIDELYSERMQIKDIFRIVIIKADLDGMGEFFKQEKNYLGGYKGLALAHSAEIDMNKISEFSIYIDQEKKLPNGLVKLSF
jgi:hypothetical protein